MLMPVYNWICVLCIYITCMLGTKYPCPGNRTWLAIPLDAVTSDGKTIDSGIQGVWFKSYSLQPFPINKLKTKVFTTNF